MTIAAFWGTTSNYTVNHDGTIIVETSDLRVSVISKEVFDHLYFRLDKFNSALKEDCVRYVIYKPGVLLRDLPEWYTNLILDGTLYILDGVTTMYDESGEIAMAPNSVILRNYRGELKYLEGFEFHQYYDTLEDWIQ